MADLHTEDLLRPESTDLLKHTILGSNLTNHLKLISAVHTSREGMTLLLRTRI